MSSNHLWLRTPLLITLSQLCADYNSLFKLVIFKGHSSGSWGAEVSPQETSDYQTRQISTKPPQLWLCLGLECSPHDCFSYSAWNGDQDHKCHEVLEEAKEAQMCLEMWFLKNILIFLVFGIQTSGNVYFYFWLHCTACGILDPRPGIEHLSLHWKHRVLTTREFPGNVILFWFISILTA